jgi:hypothetical protein
MKNGREDGAGASREAGHVSGDLDGGDGLERLLAGEELVPEAELR